MVYRNKVYRLIILHITYSFWKLRLQTPTGALPLYPAGGLPSPGPLVCHYTPVTKF